MLLPLHLIHLLRYMQPGQHSCWLQNCSGLCCLPRFLSDIQRKSSMKVYMHYEDNASDNRCMTAPIKVSESEATVEDLIGMFVEKLKTKYTDCEDVSKSDVQLSQDGKVVPRSRYASLVEDVFEEGCDVTVALARAAKVAKVVSPPVAPSPVTAKKSQADASAPKKAASKAVKSVEAPAGSTFQGADPAARLLYKQLLTMADDMMAKGMLGRAAELYREVLKVDGRQRGAHLGLGKVAVANQQWPIVIRHLRAAIEGKSVKEMKDEENDDEDDEEGLGSEASTLASAGGANCLYESYWLGKAYAAGGKHGKAVKWLTHASREVGRAGSGSVGVSRDDVSVALATSVFELGQAETAADLLNSVIHVNTRHVDAIAQCARLSARVGKPGDAMTYLLQAIVLDQKHRGVRAELCRLLSLDGGVELLLQSLPPSSESSAPPYAFLATIAKEGGAIGASASLYRAACRLCPTSASYALNLVHVLEIDAHYQAAFEHIKAFLRHQPDRRVGRQGLRCQDVLDLIKDMKEVASAPSSEAAPRQFKLEWCVRGSDGHVVITPLGGDTPTPPTQRVEEEYDAESLDVLALLFTLVKLLFLHGNALPLLPALLHAIEPTRRCSKVELHQTTIRNENAYYGCIAQLLCVPPERVSPCVALTSSPPRRPIYVCGDSHALSPAWVPLDIMGEPRLLQPALVTGLKHWHLRPETEFYPKKNFYRVVGSIPHGADVIFLFGEIDCREGLLVAVEKGRYETLTQGMEHTISIFIDAALKLVKKCNYQAYIHPIVPVLNETRTIVKAYNAIFQRRVLETKGALKWLDFFDGLLSEDKDKLRPGLELDGTHLHPDYLQLLPTAWEKAVRGE